MKKKDDKKKDKKKGLKSLDVVLLVVLTLFVVFNYQMVELYKQWGSIPEAYACAIVAALLGEAGLCGMISRTKIKYKEKEIDRQYEEEDEKKKKKNQSITDVEDNPTGEDTYSDDTDNQD